MKTLLLTAATMVVIAGTCAQAGTIGLPDILYQRE